MLYAPGLVRRVGAHRRVVVGAAHARTRSTITEVLLAKSSKTLLLGHGVDVGPNDEGDNIEEWHPKLIGQELLSKGKADGGCDPRDAHDSPEADLDRCANLVIGAGASDQSHGDQVNAVLNRRNLKTGNRPNDVSSAI